MSLPPIQTTIVSITATDLPSGSTFNGTTFSWTPELSQEGTYTISFTATDDGVPSEATTIGVVITVGDNPTVSEQVEDLIEDITGLDLPTNIENSYLANLKKVEKFIEEGKITPAINQLTAFVGKVTADILLGRIDEEVGNLLIQAAENILAEL